MLLRLVGCQGEGLLQEHIACAETCNR
jgi:hypothetical protein